MKKVVLLALFSVVVLTSCEDLTEKIVPTKDEIEEKTSARMDNLPIDPEKDCPQNDRNCNGIPDNKE